ncbi:MULTISPECIES: RpiB/LacA/LacB family sugar-phosphate isomerase [Terrabacteria group]|uniref:RpiB/LacA/LacB family sugar-phosphate isomerase n=1 Tax=Bacillati TaxID=1783272 RepID=UPI001C6F1867|nr:MULTISPECIES: RpiB/LacA/LacB family sugar-phosphate isomerase [Terrabacteria group]MBW9212328.1 RpiB/LacA/LacB family sugar-phosphate isomerase [Trueperella sp. zg.1013]
MKIALINENSQAAKNSIIYTALKEEADKKGHTVYNYGMYSAEDDVQLTYVKNGLLASILLTTKAVDFVVTGCGTGQGAMLACNSFPNVLCGHITNPLDAFLFGQVNDGNCIAMPFAQNFGWGGEVNLRYTFEKLFAEEFGGGFPKERREPEQRNKKILDGIKEITYRPLMDILKEIDHDFLKETISGKHFEEYFYPNCQDEEIANFLKSL